LRDIVDTRAERCGAGLAEGGRSERCGGGEKPRKPFYDAPWNHSNRLLNAPETRTLYCDDAAASVFDAAAHRIRDISIAVTSRAP